MSPTPSTKIPLRDIKDHADLMDYFVELIRSVESDITGYQAGHIKYLKSEIAHFLRIQSAQPGVAADDENNDPFRNSGGETKDVRKNS